MRLRTFFTGTPLRKINFAPDSTGSTVVFLQKRLREMVLLPKLTGIYDQATQTAVRAVQTAHNLPPNGIADWQTYLYICHGTDIQITPQKKATALAVANTRIHIARSTRTLTLYAGNAIHSQYPIAVGKPHTPTPLGDYVIATKVTNPGGILGTRWLGLNFESYGIHGTNRPWLIGQAVSLGCIRMHNENVEQLFNSVRLGTSVYIRE